MCDCRIFAPCECRDIHYIKNGYRKLHNKLTYSCDIFSLEDFSISIYTFNKKTYTRSTLDAFLLCSTESSKQERICKIEEDLYCEHNNLFLTKDQCRDIFQLCNIGNESVSRYLKKIGFTHVLF